jgi:RNA-binding protein
MLTQKQRRLLRARAHALHPLVLIGNHGLSDAVIAEADSALSQHELVKVRLTGSERSERETAARALCQRTGAEQVQLLGRVVTLYRPDPEAPRLLPPSDPARPGSGARTGKQSGRHSAK